MVKNWSHRLDCSCNCQFHLKNRINRSIFDDEAVHFLRRTQAASGAGYVEDTGLPELLRDGDLIRLCASEGKLEVLADLASRSPASPRARSAMSGLTTLGGHFSAALNTSGFGEFGGGCTSNT